MLLRFSPPTVHAPVRYVLFILLTSLVCRDLKLLRVKGRFNQRFLLQNKKKTFSLPLTFLGDNKRVKSKKSKGKEKKRPEGVIFYNPND